MSSFSRRRTRGASPSSSAPLLERDRAARAALRSALVSSARSQSDFGSIYEPVLLPDDRRTHIPTPLGLGMPTRASRPAQRFSGRPARVIAPPARKASQGRGWIPDQVSPAALLFSAPRNVAVCVQRGIRREVMHATGAAGRPTKRPKFGPYSKVRCR